MLSTPLHFHLTVGIFGPTLRVTANLQPCYHGEERPQGTNEDREDTSIALVAKKARRDRSEITCFGCGEKEHYRMNA